MTNAASALPRGGLAVLLGDPVAHSISPAIHNAAFRALGLGVTYRARRVEAGGLPSAVQDLYAQGALGANVTVPHKEAVVPLTESLSEEVRATGAANTLVRTMSGWRAENTDVAGFLAPLRPYAPGLRRGSIVVLGAGGAARAVVYGALRELQPGRVTLLARRPSQSEHLLRDLKGHASGTVLETRRFADAREAVREAALVVNATPVGMGNAEATPWPDSSVFHRGQIVYDLIYRPSWTRLLREARDQGATTIGGLPMLIAQAAAAFQLWTGREFPHDVAEAAAIQALAR